VTDRSDTVQRLADAIDAAPSVVARSTGRFGTIAVHLPGARVDGIRYTETGRWEVHVVMASDSTVSLVEIDVLAAARSADITGPVDVFIEDIADRVSALPGPIQVLPPADVP